MILDDVFPPDPRVENEAITLVNSGYDVFLFCLHNGNQKTNELINGIKIRRYTFNELTYKLSALSYDLPFYRMIMKPKINHFIKKMILIFFIFMILELQKLSLKQIKNTN